jgi:hypothetical protein
VANKVGNGNENRAASWRDTPGRIHADAYEPGNFIAAFFLGEKLGRIPTNQVSKETKAAEKWSGRWESNPRPKLGKL